VVANAGIAVAGSGRDTSEAQWQLTLDINLSGVWRTARAAIPTMVEQQYGRLVLVSSVGGVKAVAGLAAYCASKAGVIALTKCLALELAEEGITANAIAPATVMTGLNRHLQDQVAEWTAAQAIKNVLDPEDVSAAVAYLASDEARYVTGTVMLVDAGFAIK
jgi:NAD(P)-dependent dehydrogenase (short-subunit alcohol dehydrogenase family)